MKLTSKKVLDYMSCRTDEEFTQCPEAIAAACNDMAEDFNSEFDEDLNAKEFMKLLFFNDPIPLLHTHNYGFHTATGRNIIQTVEEYYYKFKNLEL